MLVQDIFITAMEMIGATTLDEIPEPYELQKCMRHANIMIDSWSANNLMLLATVQENFILTANKGAYTIGIGGDFNTSRPIKIVNAFIRDVNNYDYPVDIITREEYEAYYDKLFSGARPERLFFDPGVTQQLNPMGTVYLYPMPDTSYKLYMDEQKYLTEFANLTDIVSFPPAYYDALVSNLAVRIWRPMGRTGLIPPDIARSAETSMRTIEGMNATVQPASLDMGGRVGRGFWNVYTDSY